MWCHLKNRLNEAHTGLRESIFQRRFMPWSVALMVVCLSALTTSAQVNRGDAFPDLRAVGLIESEMPETSGHVVLVDFWASWCAPCKASFPALARLHKKFEPRGLVIVAVSVDEKPAAYAAFLKKMQPPFVVAHDHEQKLVNAVKVPTMPTSYLIGRDGRVRFVHRGFHGSTTEAELRRNIESMLNENNPPQP